ncbi:replication initiation protein [Roseateles sp. DAIF2]|nr:replication initiation protein [Roseateles sp. DAIF2]
MRRRVWIGAATAMLLAGAARAGESQCYGSVSRGRLEGGVKLPQRGENFVAYSGSAALAGRTHVHSRVAAIVLEAFAALQRDDPSLRFVYGETGWAEGGRLRPHRTHQNGLSVDFFVPVRDAAGASVPLPTPLRQRFGYDIEFDAQARYGDYRIDFEALAEHLYQLHRAAQRQGAGIALVIFDTRYLPRLFATPRGAHLRQHLRFMQRQAWVRHDEHYHVDFAVPCRPL